MAIVGRMDIKIYKMDLKKWWGIMGMLWEYNGNNNGNNGSKMVGRME